MAVNDIWVMDAFRASLKGDSAAFVNLSDANGRISRLMRLGKFAELTGLTKDCRAAGMGLRGYRFALLAEDGVVKWFGEPRLTLEYDEMGQEKSKVDNILANL